MGLIFLGGARSEGWNCARLGIAEKAASPFTKTMPGRLLCLVLAWLLLHLLALLLTLLSLGFLRVGVESERVEELGQKLGELLDEMIPGIVRFLSFLVVTVRALRVEEREDVLLDGEEEP